MVLTLFVKKECSLAFLVVILGTIVCGAISISHEKSIVIFNSHYFSCSCNATIGECRMDEEFEFAMDPEISRRLLQETGVGVSQSALNANAAVGNCPGTNAGCVPDGNGNVNSKCKPFNRCRLGSGN